MGKLHNSSKTCWNCPAAKLIGNVDFRACGQARDMNADIGERTVVENTKEIYPNVFVAGMAANAAFGANRMGPIFGGMLLSGKKLASMLIDRLENEGMIKVES